jgi:predicted nucleic acid-binding protein
MLVPAQVYEEIQMSRCSPDQLAKIQGFLARTNVALAEQTPAVTRKAAEIMRKSHDAGLVTRIKDARIAASAIVFEASILHSVDSDLLRLSGSDIVDGLSVMKPVSLTGQMGLL